MSSGGGMVEEGLALYGFIRSLPVDITIHNINSIDSIALAVYLGASRRSANPDATFLMHDFYFPQPVPVSNRHQASDISIGLSGSRKRFMNILKSRTNMTDEQFESLKFLGEASIKTAEMPGSLASLTKFTKRSFPPAQNWLISSIDAPADPGFGAKPISSRGPSGISHRDAEAAGNR
jgi:ClpP protease-like protein